MSSKNSKKKVKTPEKVKDVPQSSAERKQRATALHYASNVLTKPDDVLEAAGKFYDFLTGKTKAAPAHSGFGAAAAELIKQRDNVATDEPGGSDQGGA